MRQHTSTCGRRAIAEDDGFTIIEVIVASLVLVVGILGVLTMLTGSLTTTAASTRRVAATNLARELVEATRSLDYDDLAVISTRLQARGLGSGSPWTIQRRGVTYTVTVTTCAFDNPSDGYAATAPANACNTNAAGTDSNGDDFRRATFRLTWNDGGKSRSLSQTTLIVNPTGGLGPRIISNTAPAISADNVDIVWTTTPAQSLHWDADDGVSNGNVTGSTSFTTTWPIGTVGSGSEVLDGTYTITAQAFDDRDIAGEAKRVEVVIDRRKPYAPTGFTGGHDTRLNDWVDFDWSPNRERDILGYRVVWGGPDGIGNGNDEQVCPAPAVASYLPKKITSCADFAPHPGTQIYYVVAVDGTQAGDATTVTVNNASGRPDAPTDLGIGTTVDGQPRLSWTAPGAGGVAFYRIYRDGTAFSATQNDRYDRTNGTGTTFNDSSPGTTSHQYWVTAVSSSYNESDPVGPVTWSP